MYPAPAHQAFADDLFAWALEGDPPHPADLSSALYSFLGHEYASEFLDALAAALDREP